MLTLNLGPCRRRARALEEIDNPTPMWIAWSEPSPFFGFLNGGLGGNRVILNFIKAASSTWTPFRPITFLELRCGRGDLSANLVRWAKAKGFDVRVFSVDECPAVVELARDYYGSIPEITFDVRFLTDPRFLEAQQFDYVISSSVLHTLDTESAVRVLKPPTF